MKTLIQELDEFEDEFITKFREHDVLNGLHSLDDQAFKYFLLQRRHISFQFDRLYNEAIDFLTDREAINVVEYLRNEEYPPSEPSHRQNLFTDLTSIGLAKVELGEVSESRETKKNFQTLRELVRYKEEDTDATYDIKAICTLRMAEEILVAEAYRFILPELGRRYNLKPAESVFYQPHFVHDQKKVSLGEKGISHSDGLGELLVKFVIDTDALQVAKNSLENAYIATAGFYDQFKGMVEHSLMVQNLDLS